MVAANAQVVWKNACEKYFKSEVPTLTYTTWFSKVNPFISEDGIFVLGVPTKLTCDFITPYVEFIANALKMLTQRKYEVKVEVLENGISSNSAQSAENKKSKTDSGDKTTSLNPYYSFENFVVGSSNGFAHAACVAVAAMSDKKNYNPLFLYGGSGLGKTHLIHAIGNQVLKDNKLKEAEEIYNKIKCYNNPYDTEVEYEFALVYAKKRAFQESVSHLTLAYDIENSFLEKAENNEAFKDMPSDLMDAIIKKELDRKWNVITFDQISPNYNYREVRLIFREEYQSIIDSFLVAFPERVQYYFKKCTKKNPTDREYFNIISNCDRNYVHYEQILLAIKQMSPYVEDCRFFMESESKNYIDEILIYNRKFYTYRHFCKDCYKDSKIETIENVFLANPSDASLKNYLSIVYTDWVELDLRNINFYDNDSINDFKKNIKKALFYDKNNAKAYYLKGQFFEKLEKTDLSEKTYIHKRKKCYKKALALDKNLFQASYELGKFAFEKGKFKKSIQYFNKVVDYDKQYRDVLFERGCAYAKLFQNDKAKEDFENHIHTKPIHQTFRILFSAGRLINENLFDFAQLYINTVLKNNNQNLEDVNRREVSSNGSSTDFYKSLKDSIKQQNAKAYAYKSIIEENQNQDYLKALEYTKIALEYNNTNVDILYNQACYLHRLNKLDLAEKTYFQVLEIEPNYPKALFNLSHILLGKNKLEDALIYNEFALEANPRYYKALILKGNILFQQKKYKEAIKAYKTAIEIKPEDVASWEGLGLCYSWLGDNENAIFYNKKAIEIDPDNYMVLSCLGSNLNNVGQYEEALSYLNSSITINDKYYYSYYCKACVFSKTKQLEEAISMIKKVLELEPSQFEVLKNEPDFENIRNSEAFKQIFGDANKP